MNDVTTRSLPLLTLNSGVVLPQMVVTIAVETDESAAAVDAALESGGELVIVPKVGDHWGSVGTIARLDQAGKLPNGRRAVFVRGIRRARTTVAVPGTGTGLWVQVEEVPDPEPTERDRELAREYRAVVENILEQRGAPEIAELIRGMSDPAAIAEVAGYSPDVSLADKVELLETLDLTERLEKVLGWGRETLANLTLKEEIRRGVNEGMEQTQREFLLRQQLSAIRKELGDEGGAEAVDDLRLRFAEVADAMPDSSRAKVSAEIDRFERTSDQSPEHGWIRTWLDTVLGLPWGKRSEDRLDVTEARATLDADHTGLEVPKERIVEHLAVRKLLADRGRDSSDAGVILALVGPPGVGKTSIGRSVARAMGREYVRVALGGVRDEAEIRGHRRTYVGAQAGRIAKAISEAGTMNPVFVLDEVDKLGADWRGDPSSALLEVLDPAQNNTFRDHYLEVDLDLSDVLFIATANTLDSIPAPLLDRMEVITLDGYTTDEKVRIAADHLLARQRERAGLDPDEVEVTEPALRLVVESYTREAGVRGLERQVGKLLRKTATRIAEDASVAPIHIDEADVSPLLGRARFFPEVAQRVGVPGVATGLAVTGVGGDVLFVEATRMDGEPGLTLTGQLGEVMQESAQIALSYLRANPSVVGRPVDFDRSRFHVHVPAGSVPKDGPSAGVTLITALVSLLTGRPVRPDVGMTGEVTLQGRVLPIGGVKQKVLAAHRAGLRTVILPERNGPDLDDVPEHVLAEMEVHLVDDVRAVLDLALGEAAAGEAGVGEAHRGTAPGDRRQAAA